MAKKNIVGVIGFCILTFNVFAGQSLGPKSGDLLTGKADLACKIMLCLGSGGVVYDECRGPLKAYWDAKPSKRPKMLSYCPLVPDGKK